jgi:exoribonuclease II
MTASMDSSVIVIAVDSTTAQVLICQKNRRGSRNTTHGQMTVVVCRAHAFREDRCEQYVSIVVPVDIHDDTIIPYFCKLKRTIVLWQDLIGQKNLHYEVVPEHIIVYLSREVGTLLTLKG